MGKTEKPIFDAFLSYSSKDKEKVRDLAEQMRSDGLRVWFDEWEVYPGDPIPLRIEQGIEQSKCLFALMSKNYFASEWATIEYQTLMFREPTNKSRRFIPVLLSDCIIPDVISQFSYIDLRDSNASDYKKILDACKRAGAVSIRDHGIKHSLQLKLVEKYTNLRVVRLAERDSSIDLAIEAACRLSEIVTHRTRIAIGYGMQLFETINLLERKQLYDVQIYPLCGTIDSSVNITDSIVLTYLLWSKFDPYNSKAMLIPSGVPKSVAYKIIDEYRELVNEILNDAVGANVFLFTVGGVLPKREMNDLIKTPNLQNIDSIDVAGEFLFHLINSKGEFIELIENLTNEQKDQILQYYSKLFTISAMDIIKLKKSRFAELFLVAGGKDKRGAIKAMLEGNFATTLVTDVKTANWILNE